MIKCAFHDLNLTVRLDSEYTLVGPNGAGKTACCAHRGEIPPQAGRVRLGSNVAWIYDSRARKPDGALNPLETIRAILGQNETELRAFLSYNLFRGDDVFIPNASLSYGERSRLMWPAWWPRAATSCCSTSRLITSTSLHERA